MLIRPDGKKHIFPVVTWAGMRREIVRRDNNAGMPDDESLLDEISWRSEHRQ